MSCRRQGSECTHPAFQSRSAAVGPRGRANPASSRDLNPPAFAGGRSPYSPDFNPIENFFSKLKAYLRKVQARTKSDLAAAI